MNKNKRASSIDVFDVVYGHPIILLYDVGLTNSLLFCLAQFAYGEDGLDVTKVPFLKTLATMDVLVQNNTRLMEPRALALAKSTGQRDQVEHYMKKVRWRRKRRRRRSTCGVLYERR